MKQMLLVSLFVLASACESSGDNSSAGSSYEEAHAAAVAAIDHSALLGHAWSTADALLEQAVAANADGNDELAIELADSARIQAELASKQADIEEDTWQERVLSD